MPYVFITTLDRGPKKQRAAIKAVTAALAKAFAIPPEWISVIVNKVTEEQVAIGGALLADRAKKSAKSAKARAQTKKLRR